MKPRSFAIAVLLAACSNGTEPSSQTFSVQGIVQDSLAGKPVAGVMIALRGYATVTTDFLGSYQFSDVGAGSYTIVIDTPGYEPFSRSFTVSGASTQNIPLRRLAPFLKSFSGATNSKELSAVYVDLQGAASIAKGSSFVTYFGRSPITGVAFGNNVSGLAPASITILDVLTAQLTLNTGQLGIQQATWDVRDSEGNARLVVCVIGGTCIEQ